MALIKSEKGQSAFKTRSPELSPRQRSAFILFDGKRSILDVLRATAGLGVTGEDVDNMVASGMLTGTPDAPDTKGLMTPVPSPALAPAPAPAEGTSTLAMPAFVESTPQERYQRAYPIATRLTAALGLRGFRLNLAVEAAGSYEQLLELAPRIRDAVGDEKFVPLGLALSE
jgi:hypothetical protein